MNFEHLKLHPKILKAITELGYSTPTEIQCAAIPKVLEKHDLRASAQTGTGKTAAFLLPALNHCIEISSKPAAAPLVLILAPSRELAMQIATQAEKYSKYLQPLKTVCLYGGVPYHEQLRKLSRPYEILIATPGRLMDFLGQGKVNFSRLEMLVLDEADRMLDMGFVDVVEQIVAATPSSRQTLLFSATMEGDILNLSKKLLKDPLDIIIQPSAIKNITQTLHYADDLHHKNRLLDHILTQAGVGLSIIFTSTKRHAAQLVEELYDKGHRVAALHGDMSQRQRTRTITQLKNGKIQLLVATDVAARGIDVPMITHVINFDLPRDGESYVHRIGRTGRAGATGVAFSFATGRDSLLVKKIEKFTGHRINVAEIQGLEPRKKAEHSFKPKKRAPQHSYRPKFKKRSRNLK